MAAIETPRFFEFLDAVQLSFDHPNEQLIHQIILIPKRRIEEIDDLVRNKKLEITAARERLLIIQRTTYCIARDRARNNWTTTDKLDEVFAKYQKTVSGQDSHRIKSKDYTRRAEAMMQFEDVGRLLQMNV